MLDDLRPNWRAVFRECMTAAAFAGEHPNCKAVQAAELMKRIADELDDGRMPALPSVSEVMNIVRANADAVAAT